MTKKEIIRQLENYLEERCLDGHNGGITHQVNLNVIQAMDLLASLKGWKTHICNKQSHSKFPTKIDCHKVDCPI